MQSRYVMLTNNAHIHTFSQRWYIDHYPFLSSNDVPTNINIENKIIDRHVIKFEYCICVKRINN